MATQSGTVNLGDFGIFGIPKNLGVSLWRYHHPISLWNLIHQHLLTSDTGIYAFLKWVIWKKFIFGVRCLPYKVIK